MKNAATAEGQDVPEALLKFIAGRNAEKSAKPTEDLPTDPERPV